MKKFTTAILVAGALIAAKGSLAQDTKETTRETKPVLDRADQDQDRPVTDDEKTKITAPTQVEWEIAQIRIAELNREIDLAKLAYQKARTDGVRRYASRMEEMCTAHRSELERLVKSNSKTIVRTERVEVRKPAVAAPEVGAKEAAERLPIRRGEGSQDPSSGARPDAGSLDAYNRNSTNSKADSEEDKARLRAALEEQTTPTVLDKRRDVEKPATGEPMISEELRQPDRWVKIQQRVIAQRLKNARASLSELGGAEFDAAYLRMQALAHEQVIDSSEAYATYVTADHRGWLEAEMKSAGENLQEVNSLLAQLGKAPEAAPLK